MSGDLDLPRRRHMRLEGYDYALAGAYFITICVAGRRPLLGTIRHGAMQLSAAGNGRAHRRCVQGWRSTCTW